LTVYSDFPGIFYVIFSMKHTHREGTYRLIWSFEIENEPITRREIIEVVTPYTTISEVRQYAPELSELSYDEIKDTERLVRSVINSFCGQPFTYHPNTTITVQGVDGNSLSLPTRIIKLNYVTSDRGYLPGMTTVSPGGSWAIRGNSYGFGYRNIKADIWPGGRDFFRSNQVYSVNGDFGWEFVPNAINLAARKLVENYHELESEWRRKNVSVMRAADWRMEFASKPITTTGNIDVDVLLMAYTSPNVVIL
jgi:hypothetical protein